MKELFMAELTEGGVYDNYRYIIGIFSTQKRALIAIQYAKTKSPSSEKLCGKVSRLKIDEIPGDVSVATLEEILDNKKGA